MKSKLVIDTNILLDLLVFDDQRAHPLRAALNESQLIALGSAYTVAEFLDVIARPQFNLNAEEQTKAHQQLLEWLTIEQEEAIQTAPWKCKDKDDQIYLNLAFSHRPCTLLSKDKQVLKLAKRARQHDVVITNDHNKFLLAL